jgi:hypothetical protein
MRKIIIFLILLFSSSVFADTYTAYDTITYKTQYFSYVGQSNGSLYDACTNQLSQYGGTDRSQCNPLPQPDGVNHSYSCPAGGTLSGTNCINASPCVAPQTRNATTGMCELICNYTPTLTTVGSTQTIHWETDGGSGPCVSNSISCQAPLVANVEMKRCDLSCWDGSTANVDGGQQCPPRECEGQQTYSYVDDKCHEPICDANEYLALHTCIPDPTCDVAYRLDKTQNPPACVMKTCTLPEYLNLTTGDCELPKPECPAGEIYSYNFEGCIPNGCPAGYSPDANGVCAFKQCPPYTIQGTDATGKTMCTPTTTDSTTTGTQQQTTSGTSSETGTTTPNPDGTTTTTTQGTNQSTTTTTTSQTNPNAATESTLRDISNKLNGVARNVPKSGGGMGTFMAQGKNNNPDLGKWYTPTDKTFQSVLQDNVNTLKNNQILTFGQDIFNITIPGGTCPVWTIPAVMGMQSIDVTVLCGDLAELMWPVISGVLQFLAVLMAFRIALSGFR